MTENVSISGPNVDKLARILEEGHHFSVSVDGQNKLTFNFED